MRYRQRVGTGGESAWSAADRVITNGEDMTMAPIAVPEPDRFVAPRRVSAEDQAR